MAAEVSVNHSGRRNVAAEWQLSSATGALSLTKWLPASYWWARFIQLSDGFWGRLEERTASNATAGVSLALCSSAGIQTTPDLAGLLSGTLFLTESKFTLSMWGAQESLETRWWTLCCLGHCAWRYWCQWLTLTFLLPNDQPKPPRAVLSRSPVTPWAWSETRSQLG